MLTSFRRKLYDEGAWRTVIAPVLAAVGAVVLAAQHAELLKAASPTVNMVLMLHPGGRGWRGVGPGAAHQQGGHARGISSGSVADACRTITCTYDQGPF